MSRANALEMAMLALINEERAAVGAPPLRFNGDLNEASEDHSLWMLDTDVFSHTGESGSSAGDRIVSAGYVLEGDWTWGENIGWQSERGEPGLADDVRDIHESLMNSPGHRANILNPEYEEIGIGIEQGDFRGFDGVVITQNFGTTDAVSVEEPVVPDTPVTPEPDVPVVDNDDNPQIPEDEMTEEDEDPVVVVDLPPENVPEDEDVPVVDELPEVEEDPEVVDVPDIDETPEDSTPDMETPVAENDPEPETPTMEEPEEEEPLDDQPEQEEFAFDLDAFLTDLSNRIETLIEERFRFAFGDNDNFLFSPTEDDPILVEDDGFMVVDTDQGGDVDMTETDYSGCDDFQLAMDWGWSNFDATNVWDTAA